MYFTSEGNTQASSNPSNPSNMVDVELDEVMAQELKQSKNNSSNIDSDNFQSTQNVTSQIQYDTIIPRDFYNEQNNEQNNHPRSRGLSRNRRNSPPFLNKYIPGRDKPRTLIIERLHCLCSIPIIIFFIIVLFISFTIGISFAPSYYKNLKGHGFTFTDSDFIDYMSGGHTFEDNLGGISTLNQQLIATLTVYKRDLWNNITISSNSLKYRVVLVGRPSEFHPGFVINTHSEFIHTTTLNCPQGNRLQCLPITVAFLQPTIYPFYTIYLELLNFDSLNVNLNDTILSNDTHHDWHFIGDDGKFYLLDNKLDIRWSSFNPDASNWELGWRYTQLFISIGFTLFYFIYLAIVSDVRFWTMEQWWVGFLLILLNLYNNPLIGIEILIGSSFLQFINQIFVSLFISYLLLSILIIVHGSIKSIENRSFIFFYTPKILLVGIIYISVFLYLSFLKLRESLDPAYNYYDDETSSNIVWYFGVFLGVGVIVYTFMLIYYVIRGIETWRAGKLKTGRRNRFWILTLITGFILLVTIADVIILLFRYVQNNAAAFLIFFLFYNLYGITMGFLHLPTFQEKKLIQTQEEDNALNEGENAYSDIENDENIDLFDQMNTNPDFDSSLNNNEAEDENSVRV